MARSLLRWLDRLLILAPLCLTAAVAIWLWQANPFARILVDRTEEAAAAALHRAMAREVTPEWYARELETALTEADLDRVEVVALSGARQGIAPSAGQMARIEALEAAETGFWATAGDCAVCIADVAQCPSLRLLGACAIPVELTPVGDLNALRRAGMAAVAGEEADSVEVGLALAGLTATGAILASGGSSVTVKAGTTAIRLARRLGTLTPRFGRELARLADIGLRPARLLPYSFGRVPLEEVVDTARLSRLADVSGDLARVAGNTSLPDAVALLRHVETSEDAARLARLSDLAGDKTRPIMEILGPGRAFRALVRVSDLALGAAAAIWLAAGALLALLGERVGRMLLKGLRSGVRASARRMDRRDEIRPARRDPPPLRRAA